MFERFTDHARQAVVAAQNEAHLHRHLEIDTGHILLGLISVDGCRAVDVLESLGISLHAIRQQVDANIGQGTKRPGGHIPFTPRVKTTLEFSLREALQLGHNYIGTEHLLLALLREGEGVAARVLRDGHGIDLIQARRQVIQLLDGPALEVRGTVARAGEADIAVGQSTASGTAEDASAEPGPIPSEPDPPDPAEHQGIEAERQPEFAGPSLIVPSMTAESTFGADQLDIDKDAQAFASLISSNGLKPPLAIAIFGPWGGGKTFFMRRVQLNIEALTSAEWQFSGEVFNQSVVHVWFSAWHYAGGNLWASLLHHIFSSLNHTRSRREEILDALMNKVEGARQFKEQVESRVSEAEQTLAQANKRIAVAEASNDAALEKIKDLQLRDLWTSIILTAEDQQLKAKVAEAARGAGLGEIGDSAKDLAGAADVVAKTYSQVKTLATVGTWYKTPLALSIYTILVVSTAATAIGLLTQSHSFWLGRTVLVLGQVAAVASAVAAWLTRQAAIVKRFLTPAERLRRRLEDRLEEEAKRRQRAVFALKQQREAAHSELVAALTHQAAISASLASAERERAELNGSELLRRYLLERAGSGDYERYLGVIGLAHRDLKDLSEYFAAALDDSATPGQRIDRIVLYIDDLDRCQPETVTAVLDAVHLLLALPLFVVLVGIDPRWARHALDSRHPQPPANSVDGQGGSTALDYLEKIFQLNYLLPAMNLRGATRLLQASAAGYRRRTEDDVEQYLPGSGYPAVDEEVAVAGPAPSKGAGRSAQIGAMNAGRLAEAVTLSPSTIDALSEVACLVTSSPRRAKRFLNIYLLVRARLMEDEQGRAMLEKHHGADHAMVLVALLVGAPLAVQSSGLLLEECDGSTYSTLGKLLRSVECPDPLEQARIAAFLETKASVLDAGVPVLRRTLQVVLPFAGIALKW